MALSKKTRQVRKTLLVVCEGDSEVTFIKHLRQLYCAKGAGVSVTARNAHGRGPENVINTAIALKRTGDYDHVAAFLDTDLKWSAAIRNAAEKARIELIGSTPCLEGMLLKVLRETIPEASDQCKRTLQKRLNSKLLEVDDYRFAFGRSTLDEAKNRVQTLNRLLTLMEG